MARGVWRRVVGLAALILALFPALAAAQGPVHVDVLTVDGAITSATADSIAWGIATARRDGAVCLVILLNTPGGLLDATWRIV